MSDAVAAAPRRFPVIAMSLDDVNPDRHYSLAELAVATGMTISEQTLRRRVKSGDLQVVDRPVKATRVEGREFLRFMRYKPSA